MKGVIEECFPDSISGRYAGWACLIFGGIVGGVPKLGFEYPPPFWERTGTYLMALSLLAFALSYLLRRLDGART
jgi:hypothetical protein